MSASRLRSFIQRLGGMACRAEQGACSDGELVERFVATRDQAAFEALVWRHSGLVLGVCRRLLRHEQDVEDAFQATFLVLARKASAVGQRESVGSWLYKVAYRVALAARDRAAQPIAPVVPLVDSAPGPGEAAAARELALALDAEVNRLPARYRIPIVLHHLEGRPYDEVARHLGCSRGTLATQLARGRDMLRRRLTRRGLTLAAGLVSTGLFCVTPVAAAPPELVSATLTVVGRGGAGAAQVAALAQGALRAMTMMKLEVVAGVALAVFLAAVGAVLGVRHTGSEQRPAAARPKPAEAKAEPGPKAPTRRQSADNLKKLASAMHAYHDVHGHFPPPALLDRQGKPLLSWRVLLLRHLGHKDLFKEFRLNEPWDSTHNRKFLARAPAVFLPVRGAGKEADATFYQVFAGPGTIFEGPNGIRVEDVIDGTSMTVLLVEAATPVPWTKPADVSYSAKKPIPRLGGLFKAGFHVAIADGSTRFVKKDFPEKLMHAAISRGGGEFFDLDDLGR
jgi:RNA polymerase sigma factor (sigma-70 family)